MSKIVDLIKNTNRDLKIGIWGFSLGGAIAIQSLEIDKRIEFGIIESTFTAMDKIVFDYTRHMMGPIGTRFIADYGLKRAGEIADFDPHEVKPIKAVEHIEQPTLIAHGDADANISVEYGKELFEKLKAADKELIIVEGGGHLDMFEKGGVDYTTKLIGFINRNLQ